MSALLRDARGGEARATTAFGEAGKRPAVLTVASLQPQPADSVHPFVEVAGLVEDGAGAALSRPLEFRCGRGWP
jgi:hypothetical protein